MKIIVALPAYNASKTLEKTVKNIPKNLIDEIILVDDASCDNTFEIAKSLGLIVLRHSKNKGYGANQKSCYKLALERGADIVAMLHPDDQYNPKYLKYFIEIIKDGYFDIIIGTRIRSRKEVLKIGMPIYKYYSNRFLSFIENFVTGYNLSEWHSGMRVYKRKVLESIDFNNNSDDFIFDAQMILKAIRYGFKIGEISIPFYYGTFSSSINFSKSLKYGIQILWLLIKYIFKK